MEEHSENFNKDLENIGKYQTEVEELKNTVTGLIRYTRGNHHIRWYKRIYQQFGKKNSEKSPNQNSKKEEK